MNNMKYIEKEVGHRIFLFLIIINYISFLDYKIFNIYTSIALYVNLILLIFIFILNNRINNKEQGDFFFLIVFTIYGLFTLIITDGGFGSVISPAYSVLIIMLYSKLRFDNKTIKNLLFVLVAINLFWVFKSPGYYEKFFYNKNDNINSNTIGMILMYTAIYINIFIKKLKCVGSKFIIPIVFALSSWAILNCKSRGSLITLIMFFIFDNLIPKVFWKNKKRIIVITCFIIIIGVLFPFVYMRLYNNGYSLVIPFTDKPLYTGREIIWNNFYINISESITSCLFGLGSKADVLLGESLNLHNNYLGVINNFGIIGFVMYYGFLIKQISYVYRNKQISNFKTSLILGFLCVLINGYVEISTLWYVMFFMNFMFLGLALNNNGLDDNIQNEVNINE